MNIFTAWARRVRPFPVATLLCITAGPPSVVSGWAQTPPSGDASPTHLDRVTVTGNPLGRLETTAPVSELSGDALTLRRGSSLGETLSGLPGVASTYFGPNANRPTIRGLDGDRVKVMNNAGASLDASSLSFDHAVPIDPLVVERIEVLRGPAALFYGGSAVGGVVNALDNRIPTRRLEGSSGSAELRLGGAATERSGAAVVETGANGLVLHADAFSRKTSDLRVPFHIPIADNQALPGSERVRNSAAQTSGGALGSSVFFGPSHFGMAFDTYDSSYGVVAEPNVVIRMKRQHLAAAGEFKQPEGLLPTIRFAFNRTVYRHEEVDGSGAIGTTFLTAGNELRLEAQHQPLGPLQGVVGLQLEASDFSALGDEAFVPSTRTGKQAVFALEEAAWPLGRLSAGLRLERVQVDSRGDADPALAPRFGGPLQRRFSLSSASLSNVAVLWPQWRMTTSFSATERAPTSFELFANGLHAATGTFEVGNPALGNERGRNVDVALQWLDGESSHLRAGVFASQFDRFIALQATGVQSVDDGAGGFHDVPRYAFQSVRARLHGIELEGQHRLLARPWTLDGTAKLDLTRASNADTGQPLPRLPPLRINLGLNAAQGPWSSRIDIDHAARQARVPVDDTPTAGYTLVNLSLARRVNWPGFDALWFVRVDNLTNRLAYSAASVQTIRGLSPLPGRAFKAGVRVTF